MGRAGLLAALLILSAPAVGAPVRVASLDLCSDQFVLALADRDQVAAVSKVAGDPHLSPLAERAAGLPRHRGTAEEIMLLRADLVLAGGFARRATLDLLGKVGATVLRVPAIPRLADLPPQLERVAEALGHPARGQLLAHRIRARIAARDSALPPGLSLGVYRPGGTMPGEGTLVADMAAALGLSLASAGRAPVPLERLVLRPPDVLVIDSRRDDRFGISLAMLNHPALAPRRGRMAVAEFPLRYWLCNSPASAEGLAVLEEAVARSLAGEGP